MTDFPETTIGTDNVEVEMVERPGRWNVGFIRNFMIVFGITGSVFDYLTFGVLLLVLQSSTDLFRTGPVHGIGDFSVFDCTGHPEPQTLLQERSPGSVC
jgi:hypothetical protein